MLMYTVYTQCIYLDQTECNTVVPLLKEPLAKGNVFNKDRIIWQQVQ